MAYLSRWDLSLYTRHSSQVGCVADIHCVSHQSLVKSNADEGDDASFTFINANSNINLQTTPAVATNSNLQLSNFQPHFGLGRVTFRVSKDPPQKDL